MPTRTVQLPSGGQVTLKDVTDLRGRDKKAVSLQMAEEGVTTLAGLRVAGMYATAGRLVVAWVLPYATMLRIPSEDKNALGELEIRDLDKIMEETEGSVEVLFPAPATPDDSDVPGSPTEPTGD